MYLPERMKMICMCSSTDWREEILQKGDHYVYVSIDEIVFVLKEGYAISLVETKDNVDTLDWNQIKTIIFWDKKNL